MWRTLTGEGPGGSGANSTSVPGGELKSAGFHNHESPLLGLLSAVSRPAVSFLQKYLSAPGRSVKRDFLGQTSEFLGPFDDILPPSQLHSLPWVSLQELGIQQPTEMSLETGYSTPLSTVLVSPVSKTLWGSFWGSEDDQRRLKGVNGGLLCAESSRTSVFVSGESAGVAPDKSPFTNTIPHLTLIQNLAVLTPDQDNGYSSLEEEQLLVAKAQLQGVLPGMTTEEEAEEEEQETEEKCEEEEELPVLKCDNKAIAFIMGCPCSDDSQSESSSEEEEESEEEEDDDDDGFDSECSISDSDEFESETERLWSALCQTDDPYNPRNFTARLESAPKPIPKPGPGPEEAQCSPVSSVSSSVSSSCSSSSWDEASESEEQENLRLLGSFCSSDPYSPLNFQAAIRTEPVSKPGLKTGSEPSSSRQGCEEEERRARKASERTRLESSTGATSNSKKKKVRFCDEVQLFFVGCEERRGPWEEFARDRARFLRRCLETEETIGYCLSPDHRGRVYGKLYGQSESQEVQTGQSETEERPSSQSQTGEY